MRTFVVLDLPCFRSLYDSELNNAWGPATIGRPDSSVALARRKVSVEQTQFNLGANQACAAVTYREDLGAGSKGILKHQGTEVPAASQLK